MDFCIDPLLFDDWESLRAIYIEGMETGLATFETEAPTWETWNESHLLTCRLAARLEGRLAGWAALGPVSRRAVYAGVAEVSIYVAREARGKGAGSQLLQALIDASEQAGFWTLQSVIMAENTPSLRLHLRSGFREVGRRERIGQRCGIWHDTILLERRSGIVGR